jgi:hypothetical protein
VSILGVVEDTSAEDLHAATAKQIVAKHIVIARGYADGCLGFIVDVLLLLVGWLFDGCYVIYLTKTETQ